jgi:glycosyltransferase involved in cell wall biosynthesis
VSVSVLIPAHNEAEYIRACLNAVLESDGLGQIDREIIVLANGCNDDTIPVASEYIDQASSSGWTLRVLEIAKGGKLNALNVGDNTASGDIRLYVDADVTIDPDLMSALVDALSGGTPCYACGTAVVTAKSWLTRIYARFWQKLPFMTDTTPGFGVFAVNRSGRNRWGDWPDIISDDTFARLNFAASERVKVTATYHWPLIEGFGPLVRVRRRQDAGVTEISSQFPALMMNEDKPDPSVARIAGLALRDPIGFAVYIAVAMTVRTSFFQSTSEWERGR